MISTSRKHERSSVYFDYWRFPNGNPSTYDARRVFRFVTFLRKHAEKLNRTAGLLDAESRALLKILLAYRALGPVHIALPNSAKFLEMPKIAELMRVTPSSEIFPPFEMSNYHLTWDGQDIDMEGWAPIGLLARQYYYSRNGREIAPRTGDVVIDAGACFGDTALAFAATVGPSGMVHTFEPMPRQFGLLRRNVERNARLKDRIKLHAFGLGDIHGQRLRFADQGAGARASQSGTVDVEITTIDQCAFPKVDFIKMDIEGAELSALRGAKHTIQHFRPRLAISIYHSNSDLFEIALAIRELCADYALFIDHYTAHAEETVLYASPMTTQLTID